MKASILITIIVSAIFAGCKESSKETNNVSFPIDIDSNSINNGRDYMVVQSNKHRIYSDLYHEKSGLIKAWKNDNIDTGVNDVKAIYKLGKYDFHFVEIKEGCWGNHDVIIQDENNYIIVDSYYQPKAPNERIIISEGGNMIYSVDGKEIFTGLEIEKIVLDSIFLEEMKYPINDTIFG